MISKIRSAVTAAKETLTRKYISAQAAIMNRSSDLDSKFGNAFVGTCLALTGAAAPGFAAESATAGIVEGIEKASDNIYGAMKSIGIVVAVIGVALAAFYLFTGGDKGMEKAKKTILYAVIGCGILFLAVPIVNLFIGMFNDSSTGITEGLTSVG